MSLLDVVNVPTGRQFQVFLDRNPELMGLWDPAGLHLLVLGSEKPGYFTKVYLLEHLFSTPDGAAAFQIDWSSEWALPLTLTSVCVGFRKRPESQDHEAWVSWHNKNALVPWRVWNKKQERNPVCPT